MLEDIIDHRVGVVTGISGISSDMRRLHGNRINQRRRPISDRHVLLFRPQANSRDDRRARQGGPHYRRHRRKRQRSARCHLRAGSIGPLYSFTTSAAIYPSHSARYKFCPHRKTSRSLVIPVHMLCAASSHGRASSLMRSIENEGDLIDAEIHFGLVLTSKPNSAHLQHHGIFPEEISPVICAKPSVFRIR